MSEAKNKSPWIFVLVAFLLLTLFPLVKQIAFPSFALTQTQLEHTFRESIMSITPTRGDVLEVALLESNETLTRSDTKTLFDNNLYLGTTVSEIQVRVTYRYHVKISEKWELTPRGKGLLIVAPQIRPSLPPAIHTQDMQKRSDSGWLRFNASENMEALERSLTPMLESKSVTPAKIALVREASRKAVGDFVQAWVLKRPEWKDANFEFVEIAFADENVDSIRY